jgi:CDP-diacylglycerol--glycerol-3-phosphate 3-phosphatidyltransferase
MLKKINLPNKLTLLRIILVPFFVVAISLNLSWGWPIYTALGIFLFAAFTDFLDGYISRKKGLVTKFGKIMDPLADKLLISSAFIMLTAIGIVPAWITVIIVFRDFFVNSLRMFGSDNGTDLAAVLSGKIKTVFQLLGIIFAILDKALVTKCGFGSFFANAMGMSPIALMINVGMTVAISAAVLATIISFVEYIFKFKKDINIEE